MKKDRYNSKWVKEWDTETIIGQAVSLGMQYMSEIISTKDLEYNKKILVKELKRKSNETTKRNKKNLGRNERTQKTS